MLAFLATMQEDDLRREVQIRVDAGLQDQWGAFASRPDVRCTAAPSRAPRRVLLGFAEEAFAGETAPVAGSDHWLRCAPGGMRTQPELRRRAQRTSAQQRQGDSAPPPSAQHGEFIHQWMGLERPPCMDYQRQLCFGGVTCGWSRASLPERRVRFQQSLTSRHPWRPVRLDPSKQNLAAQAMW